MKPDIPSLQLETIETLRKIDSVLWESNNGQANFQGHREQILGQINLVRRSELRMAIVAQMNAGKSTIINAIIGQDLLPTHDAAMTTLPTELVFNAALEGPVLKLSKDITSKLQQTIDILQDKIKTQGIEWAIETVSSPYLNDQIQKIKRGVSISSAIKGHEPIIETLTLLNHILRLYSKLAPETNLLESLTDVPRIETPFWRSQQTEELQTQGNLVLVDTPGQNEAGSPKLREIVVSQLQRSSLVLIVLDYTQLNGDATAEVKQEVQKVIELRGQESLYVLVNKVDQRGRNAMTSEQVKQFIIDELGIKDPERVFEISARKAFYATNFLRELQNNPNLPIAEMETAEILAKQAFGEFWQETFLNADAEKMQSVAEKIWQGSGFAPFLKHAINTLMAEGTHRCIRTALQLGNSCLEQLSSDLIQRRQSLESETIKSPSYNLNQ
jgi:predicted GTPase